MTKHYTVAGAAKRVRRSPRTIEAWIAEGMQVTRLTIGRQTTRHIEETELLRWYRTKILNNPSRPHTPR